MTSGLRADSDAADTHKAILAVPENPAWPRGCEAAAYSTPLAAFEILALTCPTLVSYRGGWFRGDAFLPANADGFFKQTGGDLTAVEFVVNHLHVDEMLFGQREPMSAEIALAICHMIAFGWRNWARDRYGVMITTSIAENDGEYEVSFCSAKARE